MKITVLGAGNMGTTIAHVISSNGHDVTLWNYEGDPEPLEQIKKHRENKKYLPGIKLSSRITVEPDLEKALYKSSVVFFSVPSSFIATILYRAKEYVSSKTILVDISKGFKHEKSKQNPSVLLKNMIVISGPAIAIDLARGGFTAMNIAGKNARAIKTVRNVLENDFLKFFPTSDVQGIKICGALKNVYAILMGICDGFAVPMNTKAFLLTQALQEMGELIHKMGGKKETVYSLAGLGDLMGTGLCTTSRNRRFGEFLVFASSKAEAAGKVGQVVEGAEASKILHSLIKEYRVVMPVAELVYRIVWLEKNIKKELDLFLKSFHVSKKS